MVENDISRFWRALVDNGVEKDGRLWTLADSVPWIGGVDTFYNRECYDELCLKMNSKRRFLVKGTPGIGKTMFLQRVLVDIVEKDKDEAKENNGLPRIDYVRNEEGVNITYRLQGDGTTTVANDHNFVDFVLSDSVDVTQLRSRVLTLVVASDNKKNFKLFSKLVSEATNEGMILFMQLCPLDELMAMNPGFCHEEGQIRFDIFGGSARNFKAKWTGHVRCISWIEGLMSWYFSDEDRQKYHDTLESALSFICQEFKKSSDEDYNILNSMMRHREANGDAMWASKFMEVLAIEIYEKRETSMYAEIEKLVGPSGVGNLFESISHAQLSTSKTGFNLIPLHRKGARGVSRVPVSFTFPEHVARLRNVEDISHLSNQSYGLPVTPNFPLVDAIVQPAVLLQMTVSEERHKGAVNRLGDIRGCLQGNPAEHKMVFVVPKKNIKSFKYQEDLSDIPQFVLCPDPVLNTVEQNKKRKRIISKM